MFRCFQMLLDALRSVPLEVGPLMMTFKYASCLFLPVRFQGVFNCSLCFSKLNCRVGWPSIEKWRTGFSSNLELWDEIESYKRWSTWLCRAQNKATQWLNLVDFFAIAPYYVSLRCLAQQVFSWYASHTVVIRMFVKVLWDCIPLTSDHGNISICQSSCWSVNH